MTSPGAAQTSARLPLPVISATYLTGATLVQPMALAEVEALVSTASAGLRPKRLLLDRDEQIGQCYPVLIDLWQLNRGRLELAGLTQHQWSELAYGTLGGVMGLAFGALRGAGRARADGNRRNTDHTGASVPPWQQALAATMQGGLDGFRSGVSSLSRVGRSLSENSAGGLGNYVEVMFSIPGVRLASESRQPCAGPFVLSAGVYTDSRPACAIDKNFGYGLGKTLASIEFGKSGPGQLTRVIDGNGREVLSATLRARERLAGLPANLARWLDAPLLGVDRTPAASSLARARRSYLRRHFQGGVLLGLEGELCLTASPFGLPAGTWPLTRECIAYERIWSEITLPGAPS